MNVSQKVISYIFKAQEDFTKSLKEKHQRIHTQLKNHDKRLDQKREKIQKLLFEINQEVTDFNDEQKDDLKDLVNSKKLNQLLTIKKADVNLVKPQLKRVFLRNLKQKITEIERELNIEEIIEVEEEKQEEEIVEIQLEEQEITFDQLAIFEEAEIEAGNQLDEEQQIQIFVKCFQGKTKTYYINPTDTCKNLFQKVLKKEGVEND